MSDGLLINAKLVGKLFVGQHESWQISERHGGVMLYLRHLVLIG
jgi:hypothetical protein